ncbi:MAG TPA: acylphosphatase, partial [Chitinophagaceae bacterium]|nr:acylphosphatase [Chitinophagaceae bacterium]
MVSKQFIIRGKVQGVYFRVSAKKVADELGLRGEVRNLRDGSVEVLVVGEEEKVRELADWCHRGPSRAEVREVEVLDVPFREFEGFKVVRG